MPLSFQMKAWWGQKCSFCLSVCSCSHNCRPHSKQPWLLPAAFGCHEPVTAIKLLTRQDVPGYRAQEDAHIQPVSPSKRWWRPERFLETPPQETVLHSLPCSSPPFPGGGKPRSGNIHSIEFPRKGTASQQLMGNIPWATVTLLCNP